MLQEPHLQKARGLERTLAKLDTEDDWETMIETCYGAAMNYIAYLCEKKVEKHLDSHKGLPRFLDELGLTDLARLFREIDHPRMAGWYGGKKNGTNARAAMERLEQIKEMCNGHEQ